MTIIDFALLTTAEQLTILHNEGVFLCKRNIGNIHVLLYQYNKLYVEIYYTKYRREVQKIRCSEEVDILTPYLHTILIDKAFSYIK